MLVGVFTQLLGHGGIPYAGRQAAAVIAWLSRQFGTPFRILGLNDPAGATEVHFDKVSYRVEGFSRAKWRLASEVLSAIPRLKLAYFGHVSLAPLGLPMKLNREAHYVVAGHGIEVWRKLPPIAGAAVRGACAITAPSRFTAERMRHDGRIEADRLCVIPWGLDPRFIQRREAQTRVARPPIVGPVVLTVSRLDASECYKGVDDVIHAVASLRTEFPDLTYVVVGDGSDRPRLRSVACKLGLEDSVRFMGSVPDEDIAYYYGAADVYAMPSNKEGMGFSFLEAMACAKPIVAARAGATPEVVDDGVTGFLVEYRDVRALAGSLALLLRDPDLRTQMGEAGRQRFQEHYSFQHFRDRLGELLATAARQGAAA